jgi:hypothetical protein
MFLLLQRVSRYLFNPQTTPSLFQATLFSFVSSDAFLTAPRISFAAETLLILELLDQQFLRVAGKNTSPLVSGKVVPPACCRAFAI